MKRQMVGWAISHCQGRVRKWVGLYQGFWYTRADAIRVHTRDTGKTWRECRASGDRCVKVVVHYEAPNDD